MRTLQGLTIGLILGWGIAYAQTLPSEEIDYAKFHLLLAGLTPTTPGTAFTNLVLLDPTDPASTPPQGYTHVAEPNLCS